MNFQLPLRTKTNRCVRTYTMHGRGEYPIHGCVVYDHGDVTEQWSKDGKAMRNRNHDLVEHPRQIEETIYVNIYRDGTRLVYGPLYESESDANRAACSSATNLIARAVPVPINVTEGYGIYEGRDQ